MHHVDPLYGLEGGGHDTSGLSLWIMKDPITDEERVINLGGKNTTKFGVGDRICHPYAWRLWLES
jgi:5-oxoprolinase (ATP-hydrolysing)